MPNLHRPRTFVEGVKLDIPPDFFTLRGHKFFNNIKCGSNNFSLGSPLFCNPRNPPMDPRLELRH
jgi:hypothetical protein